MKLAPGDTIRVTKADDQGGNWAVNRYLDAEWTGEAFLGCVTGSPCGARWVWTPDELLVAMEDLHDRTSFSNVTGMLEQLVAEGALR